MKRPCARKLALPIHAIGGGDNVSGGLAETLADSDEQSVAEGQAIDRFGANRDGAGNK